MNAFTFTNDYLKNMLDAINFLKKITLLTSNFNVNLIKIFTSQILPSIRVLKNLQH